ncbi:MAG: FAD-dependent oxidoreductase [Pseudomonadota bacterium]
MLGKSVKIIGAGVAGLAVAAELVEHGYDVRIFDLGSDIGDNACSWYAGGMLAPWCELESAEEPVARLGSEAADWWAARIEGVNRLGSLVVAPPRDSGDLKRFARRTDRFEWVDEEKIATLEPALAGQFRKGLFFGSEAHLNPRDAMIELAAYLRNEGAAFHFETDGYRTRPTDITIDTRGFAARDRLSGLRGVKGEMLIIKSNEIQLSRPVRMLHPRIPSYIVPREDGHFMVGATMIESGERGNITARSMIELLSAAFALHPAFGEAEIIEIGTDVRPAYADNLPRIVEEDGVIYVNGLYRHGFLLAPALARMTREVVNQEAVPEFFQLQTREDDDIDRKRSKA